MRRPEKRRMVRGRCAAALVVLASVAWLAPAVQGVEVLYNGIVLPDTWPPVDAQTHAWNAIGTYTPMPVPAWMETAPAVIPINVGRQFFVPISTAGNPDSTSREFLVANMTNLTRTWHNGTWYANNPLLVKVLPFSDGIWFDPSIQQYRLYTHTDNSGFAQYRSADALHWTYYNSPKGNGSAITSINSDTVWLDQEEPNAARRWKAMWVIGSSWYSRCSADGNDFVGIIEPGNWGQQDRDTMFINSFRQKLVLSVRGGYGNQSRMRYYREMNRDTFATAGTRIGEAMSHPWLGADTLDPPWPSRGLQPQLYNFDSTPYESLMIGLFSIYKGAEGIDGRYDKINEVYLGFSYDGWYYHRPTPRQPLCPVNTTPYTWNWCNVQSVVGSPLVVGPAQHEELYFYCSGRGISIYSDYAMGMRQMRRDGFCSVDAGASEGVLMTRPVKFTGKYMFVNVNDPNGSLKVEVLDANGLVIPAFAKANCQAISVDKTLQRVRWNGAADLSALVNQNVRFKFYLTNGELYAFWVAPDLTGASRGYVGGGGARYTSNKDTVGLGIIPNEPPAVDAGAAKKVMLPNSLELVGSASDDGLPEPPAACTAAWSKVSGPGTVSFANPGAAATTVTFSAAGVYVLRLTAGDTDLSALDEVTITVKAAGDFNGDGKVNGQDFLIWQSHYPTGSDATTDIGDATGDGKVNGADFLVWQANYQPM